MKTNPVGTKLLPSDTSLENNGQTIDVTATQRFSATTAISWILQGGVIASSALIVLGLLLLPTRPGGLGIERVLNFPRTFGEIWDGLLLLRPQSIIVIGLLLLIATPVVRVAVSTVSFALEHDRLYVVITLAVLIILIISFLLGKGGA